MCQQKIWLCLSGFNFAESTKTFRPKNSYLAGVLAVASVVAVVFVVVVTKAAKYLTYDMLEKVT